MPITINGTGPVDGITSLNTTVSSTELGYLDGVTSAIQTQISAKANDSAVGLVKITDQTFAGVASVNVNNCFTSTYDNYRVTLTDFTLTTAGLYQIWIRLRANGTNASGATDYVSQGWRLYSGAIAADLGSAGNSLMTLGYGSTGGKGSYVMDFFDPQRAVRTNMNFQGHMYQSDIATYIAITGSNTHLLNTAYDGFTLSSDAGPTLAGTIRVYGYRN